MLNRIKTLLIVIISALIILSVLHFILTAKQLRKYEYKFIPNDTTFMSSIFKKNVNDNISFSTAMGNNHESMYVYDFDNGYDLIIWNIKGFSEVDLLSMHLYINENFDKIKLNPMRFVEFRNFKVISSTDLLVTKTLNLLSDIKMNEINHFERDNFSYSNMISNGIALYDENRYYIKIEAPMKMSFNFAFIKNEYGFLFIILAPRESYEMREDLLLDLLKNRNEL